MGKSVIGFALVAVVAATALVTADTFGYHNLSKGIS